jgi:Holliday junction DNA helicase RuvA
VLPVHDIAGAIQRQDVKFLTTLPGIGAATAEQMVTTLKKKVGNFAQPATATTARPAAAHDGRVIEEVYAALLSLGHNPVEARSRIDAALADGHTYPTVEALLTAVYSKR